MEGVLPDSAVGSIGREYFVPNFRRGNYSAGIAGALWLGALIRFLIYPLSRRLTDEDLSLLLIEGDKAVGEKYTEFTRANNVANVEAMFTSFAKRLRSAMDRVHGK